MKRKARGQGVSHLNVATSFYVGNSCFIFWESHLLLILSIRRRAATFKRRGSADV